MHIQVQYQRYLVRQRVPLFGLILVLTLFTSCSLGGSSSASAPTATATPPNLTATPTLPTGNYAFVRDGDVWVRSGVGRAHQLTFLHLSKSDATWSALYWSPDHSLLAFTLYAPPLAPGSTFGKPSQSTGTLFLVNSTSGTIYSFAGTTTNITLPLLGQHIAWLDANTLIISKQGAALKITLGKDPDVAKNATVTPINGLQNVWEIAVRGTTLFYSTLASLQPNGNGTAELHRFDLSAASPTSQLVATLGPASEPAGVCGGFICPPDATTPYVPFAWSIDGNGTQIAYQATPAAAPHGMAPATTVTPSVTPPPTSTFFILHTDTNKTQLIFKGVPPPSDPVVLSFAPNGRYIVLSLMDNSTTAYNPAIYAVANDMVMPLPLTSASQTVLARRASWSADSQAFSLANLPLASARGTPTLLTFTPQGQMTLTEQNGDDIAWAAP